MHVYLVDPRQSFNKIKKLEEACKLISNYTPIPYQCLDDKKNILEVNQAWLDIFKFNKVEIIGKSFCELLDHQNTKLFESKFSHFKNNGVIQNLEIEVNKQKNDYKLISMDGIIEYDEKGNFKYAHCFLKDITKFKEIENKLKNSNNFLSNILSSIQDGISVLNKDLDVIMVNSTMERWYSHSMPIVGKKCYEVYHGLDKPCDACPSLRALATKKPALELVPKRGPNQEINGWLDLYAFPLTDEESDKIIGVIEYVRDISDKKKAEKELKDSEEKYKYIFENAQVGLYWSRVSDGKILECNNIFAKILGYDTSNELLGDFFASEHYVNPNDRQKIIEEIKRHGSVSGYEINVTKRDGTPIWLSISARIIEDRIEGAAIDITKRKKAKQELKESERKYKDAFNKINFFKDLLAHDVKNIFNNINMAIQMIGLQKKQKEETTVTPSEEELINMIRIQLEKGIKLISNIQRLSEIEKGEKIKKVIDLKQVINTSLQYIQTRFQERNIEIIRKMPKVIPRVLGGELLIDAFENILLNGIVHNNSKIIRLEIIVSEIHENGLAWVKIEFKDNGIGVEDERKKNIFKRKYTKNNKNGGMGIGLSLVKSIIESYGGRIWVENRIRKDHRQGSNFVMLLKKG